MKVESIAKAFNLEVLRTLLGDEVVVQYNTSYGMRFSSARLFKKRLCTYMQGVLSAASVRTQKKKRIISKNLTKNAETEKYDIFRAFLSV